MSAKNGKHKDERRKHVRFAVVEGMVEPISISFDAPPAPKNQPAILTDLSAGGMSLIVFTEPPKTHALEMMLNVPGIVAMPLQGRVARISRKGETYNVGIAFTKISKKHQTQIDGMANDNIDCETRLSLNLPEACVPTCTFHMLCAKLQKAPHWKK